MVNKKALLIINPVSGTRSKRGLDKFVSDRLAPFGIETSVFRTAGQGDAFEKAREAAREGFDMVITAGGDGTVNEAANGIAFSDTVLGILPFGSGNGLARTIGLPLDTYEALKIIAHGHVLKSDRGMANDKPFYCTCGVGFDANVSEKFASMKKRGKISYIRSAIREYLSYRSRPYAIEIQGKIITEKAFLVAICNATQYGNNAYIGPKAKLTDGLLDITLVHSDNTLSTMVMVMDLMTGIIDKNKSIDTFQTPEATIVRIDDGPLHLDGEPIHMGKKIHIKCEPEALNIFAPEKEVKFRPFISPFRAMLDDVIFDMFGKFRQFD
ncbi:MAG: diacylglycerol kinase family lipid kinase [Muribaculaceae bacterium]|nr:diacylglycerol kinase family lipid kinase [Muribaculaceae bacterium]